MPPPAQGTCSAYEQSNLRKQTRRGRITQALTSIRIQHPYTTV